MFFTLVISPKVPKKSDPGALVSRIKEGMQSSGIDISSVRISLEDSPFKTASAVARIAKRFPQLKPAIVECNAAGYQDLKYHALTTMCEPWEPLPQCREIPNLSLDEVSEIAAGIPRRWAVQYAVFVFEVSSWPELDAPPPDFRPYLLSSPLSWANPLYYWRPSVILISAYTPAGRRDELYFVVPMLPALPPHEPEVKLPSQLRQCLRAFGASSQIQYIAQYSPSEYDTMLRSRNHLYDLIGNHKPKLNEILQPLTPETERTSLYYEALPPGPPNVKANLLQAIRGSGFSYDSSRSGQGQYVFSKLQPTGFRYSCLLEVSPIGRELSATSVLEGADFELYLPIPTVDSAISEKSRRTAESIDPPERLEQQLVNIMRVLAYHEKNVIPELEQQMNPPFKWQQILAKSKKFIP